MIIVRIVGGLASQLHKYAVGRALALRHGTALKLDLGWFEQRSAADTPWAYELGKFNISADIANVDEIRAIRGWEFKNRVAARLQRSLGFSVLPSSVVDKSFMSVTDFKTLPDNVYLQGEWAGDCYFADIRDVLLADFRLKVATSPEFTALDSEIGQEAFPVAIHVRRGDFISNPNASSFHHVMGLDYYCRAVEVMRGFDSRARFFVFSDDPGWVASDLLPRLPDGARRVAGLENHEDLLLMSRCCGNIISNSGFGWTAAWINGNPDRKVIAPRLWVRDVTLNDTLLHHMFRNDWAMLI